MQKHIYFRGTVVQKTRIWLAGEEDRHERRRAREARGKQTHLDACNRLRVTPKEHPRSPAEEEREALSMLATRASSTESKEVSVWLPTVPNTAFEPQY